MTRRFLVSVCLAVFSLPSAGAQAADPAQPLEPVGKIIPLQNKLTADTIRTFYAASKKIHKQPYPEYVGYMNLHTRPDLQVTLNITNHLPNNEEKKQTAVLNKDQFMAGLADNYKISQGAEIQHTLTNLKIAEDGQSATVKDITMLSNVLDLPVAQGRPANVEIQTQSACEDVVVVGPGAVPQLQKSTCSAESFYFLKK